MAEDQAKFNVQIGLDVSGGNDAAKQIATLTREISQLERQAGQLRDLANALNGVAEAGKKGLQAAEGLKAQRTQAEALKPAIEAIRTALGSQPKELLSTLGLDSKSITAGGKSVEAFKVLTEKLATARDRLVEGSAKAQGRSLSLGIQRDELLTEARAIQRIRDKVSSDAVASDKATAQQRTQVAMESAQKQISIAKNAAVSTGQEELNAARARVAGTLRSVLSQAAQSPFGASNRPTFRELSGAGQLPMADLRQTGSGSPSGSAQALGALTTAADKAAAALGGLAGDRPAGAASAGTPQTSIARQMMSEMQSFAADYAKLHASLRTNEVTQRPTSPYAMRSGGGGGITPPVGVAKEYDNISNAANRAAGSIGKVKNQQDAVIGSVKQFLSLAAGYQVLQTIGNEISQVFSHLKGGIIGYNSMIEQATVGFTTLFDNQARAAENAAVKFGDFGKTIDYAQMGFGSAEEAATGMIDTLRQFANITPFRFEELTDSALRMRAFGFELGEVLKKTGDGSKMEDFSGGIKAVGDAVSALGGGADAFRRITYALGQMKQAGRVYQNDMMQLANAGIGGYKYIADELMAEISTREKDGSIKVKAGYEKLFGELQSNSIETVRRLTTNGQISGEQAAKAIMAGLEHEFGGGMDRMSRTFQGALSTVADTSQSLVAISFKPLYDAISKATYDLGQFLQTPEATAAAKAIGDQMAKIVPIITSIGKRVGGILVTIFGDLSAIFGGAKKGVMSFAGEAGSSLAMFGKGVSVVADLLENQVTRGLIIATLAVKLFSSAIEKNPILATITAMTIVLGGLKEAYDKNILGFRTTVGELNTAVAPIIVQIRDRLIPVISDFMTGFTTGFGAVLLTTIKGLLPILEAVLTAINLILYAIRPFATVLGGVFTVLVMKFAYDKIMMGWSRIATEINKSAIALERFSRAQATSGGMSNSFIGGSWNTEKRAPRAGIIGDLAGVAGKISGASMIGSFAASALGMDELAGTLSTISLVTFGFNMLKSAMNGINIAKITTAFMRLNVAIDAKLGINIIRTAQALGTFAGAIASVLAVLGSVAATGGAGLFPLLDPNVPGSLTGPDGPLGFLNAEGNRRSTDWQSKRVAAEDTFKGAGQLDQGRGSMLATIQQMQEDGKALEEIFKIYGDSYKKAYDEYQKIRVANAAKAYEKGQAAQPWLAAGGDSSRERMATWKRGQDDVTNAAKKSQEEYDKILGSLDLLVNQVQNGLNKAAEKLNILLGQAKGELAQATDMLQTLATGALQDLLNPKSRVNPYTGLEQFGLTLEEQLQTQTDMSFTQFTNAQGIVRNFDEYKDILNSIKPLTEADLAQGQVSLKAVEERLKIEKERRKEMELIKAAAQAEYDLGVASLQQYDQSISPLERATQLFRAQQKYSTDIADLKFQGLEALTDQSKASSEWAVATAQMKERLEQLKKGQELILNEMRLAFEQYNQKVADILANPDYTAAQKQEKLKALLDGLTATLRDKFGITEAMIDAQAGLMQGSIDSMIGMVNGSLEQPVLPNITWGQSLNLRLEAGAYGPLMTYLKSKLTQVANITQQIIAAANAAANAAGGVETMTQKKLLANLRGRLAAAVQDFGKEGPDASGKVHLNPDTYKHFATYLSGLSGITDMAAFMQESNRISGLFAKYGLAKGGYARGGSPYIVGERGPELFLPQSSGMVLNNSISSRLLSMMAGGGSAVGAGAGNVTININNPVVRSDADIRKLADQISRVQASQFRTQGGRLS
ncbi:hypothetical protein UFOVP529_2 [uncultured Caudovirales phage]|uniref:Tape measure protein n=1 Tax=uncultured Caudovirales phage TaxID=2100421 RepID=A0A6J5MQN8_9CAUD|nr:hypothetical protein UFOVP529_2 [uncultured Caudovirales phage]CAB4190439.1 hypothetical protein UFOVP1191_60 [uncultured Caudovirales phage]CAB4194543.1 hypothetical protein UFOVP1252_118 [uncultured Caudovirales phage]